MFFNAVTTVAGPSGVGKTTSMRNLDKSAVLYNVEGKELPFPKKQNQILDKRISHPNEMFLHLPKVMIRPDISIICLDSFSHAVNYFKFKTQYEDDKKGFDVYRGYNDMIFAMFELFKKMMNKYVFVLAHAEEFNEPEGPKSYIKVDGKVYEKAVEQFAVVGIHARKIRVTDDSGRAVAKHIFDYNSMDAATKAPMGMFQGQELDNDLALVVQEYRRFWGHPNEDEMIMKYLDETYTTELLKRMEEMKPFFKGPLNMEAKKVDLAFQEAYNTIPSIMQKIVTPTAQRLQGGLSNVTPAVQVPQPQPQAQPQPAPQAQPQQQAQPVQQPAPQPQAQPAQQAAPSPAPQAGPSPSPQPAQASPGLPTPGMSVSAIDELAQSI